MKLTLPTCHVPYEYCFHYEHNWHQYRVFAWSPMGGGIRASTKAQEESVGLLWKKA